MDTRVRFPRVRLAALAATALLVGGCAEQPEISPYAQLRPFEWMIGEWSDVSNDVTTKSVCRWTPNRNFITRTFEVSQADGEVTRGAEVIGWDPAAEAVRSWTFDSMGGFASGWWRQGEADGKWIYDLDHDVKPDTADNRKAALDSLTWMLGEWSDREGDLGVEFSVGWVGDQAWLNIRWKADFPDATPLEGVTVFGWDPEAGTIRSWMFDTDGGFAEAELSGDSDKLYAMTAHVLPDGSRASSVTIYAKLGEDKFSWRRVSQEVNGQLLPNQRAFTAIRKKTTLK